MSGWQPADLEARRRAIETLDANVVVLAGAGTGKTTLLVERVLHLVVHGGLPLDALAAITFTEKAAAEMRGRIALALDELAGLAAGRRDDRGESAAVRAWRSATRSGRSARELEAVALGALEALARAPISTIHAFCAHLLRAFPIETGLDPDFRIDPGPEAAARFEIVWDDFLAREIGTEPRRPELWEGLLVRGWLPRVRELAVRLGTGETDLLTAPAADTRALLAPVLERAMEMARSLRERQQGLSDAPLGLLQDAQAALRDWLEKGAESYLSVWPGRGRIPNRLGRPPQPKANTRLSGVPPEEMNAGLRQIWTLLRNLACHDEPACADLIAAAAPAARDQVEALRRTGVVGYDGLLVRARDLLRDHPAVRAALRRRWRHLLVDEFQDTDPLQYEIVLFLGEAAGEPGREPARDPFACRLEPGRLFIVGDPKQSIYRFRGADLAAFERVARRLTAEGAITLDLTQNFRSGAPLIEAVNRLFTAPGRWTPGDGQPPYVPIAGLPEAARPVPGAPGGSAPVASAGSPPVELWTLPDDVPPGQRRRREGEAIAAALPGLLDDCGATPGEVTLLLRAFTEVADYLRPLREAGIPFIADGGREFMRRPEVAQLLALARAAARPADAVPLLATLRSPVGGVSDRELADWADAGGLWDARARPEADRYPRLAAAFARLRSLGETIRSLTPDQALRRLASDSGLIELSAAAFEGAQRVANVERLIDAAARLAQQGRLSLMALLDALEDRPGEELESDSPLADEDAHAVRVLTIHRAKGLENRIVILADLARVEGTPREPPALRIARVDGRPALAVAAGTALNAAAIRLEWDERGQEQAEAARLLYVALTRARERLILIAGRPAAGRAPWIEALQAWGYDPADPPEPDATLAGGLVRHRLMSRAPVARAGAPPLPGTDTEVAAWNAAQARADEATRRPLQLQPSAIPEAAPAARRGDRGAGVRAAAGQDAAGRPRAERAVARAVGLAVHRVLERWSDGGATLETELTAAVARSAAETGVGTAAIESEARAVLQTFADSPLAARLAAITVIGREIPLLLDAGDGAVWRGSVDLLYRDEGGRLRLADFKTDRDTKDAAARYRAQLETYGEAVRRALGLSEPPLLELWLLREGRLLTLDAAPGPEGGSAPSHRQGS